jgi:ubiquitin carboxyl-terminal hydrolase 14
MRLELMCRLKCIESEEEAPSTTTESVLKLECNISITTNYLLAGIQDVCGWVRSMLILQSLNQQLEKNSSVLGRTAQYEQ